MSDMPKLHIAVVGSSLARRLLGRPDGVLVRLRCRVIGHVWECCLDDCCRGETTWCRRCLQPARDGDAA